MPLNPHVNEELENFSKSLREIEEADMQRAMENFLTQLEHDRKRQSILLDKCEEQAKKNIEANKKKPNLQKIETPEQYKAIKKIQTQSIVKKETPEEYKARKESQAQRKEKKETPEEYASRIAYMKKKEQLEIEAETQRLFDKAEKQYQNHQAYLKRQESRDKRNAEREEIREEIREANEAYLNSAEGRAEQARKDQRREAKAEETRNWNTHEACEKREKKRREQEQKQISYQQYLERVCDREKIRRGEYVSNYATDNQGRLCSKTDREARINNPYKGGIH